MATVRDILKALDVITGGRVITDSFGYGGANPFVVTKTSGIPGKAVTELPGLVWGDPDMPVKKVAVMMTLTESAIELAGATGIDGSCAKHVNIRFGGVPGKIVWYGNALPEVETLGDLLNRIDTIMGTDIESRVLTSERQIRGCTEIHETSIAARAKIFVGSPDNKLGKTITVFPHTGFSAEDLEKAYAEYPEANTVVCTISRPLPGDPLVKKAEELGLNLIAGNSHALEILENGIPLAWALRLQIPELDIHIFRERMVSLPLDHCGCTHIENYGEPMARNYLPKPKTE